MAVVFRPVATQVEVELEPQVATVGVPLDPEDLPTDFGPTVVDGAATPATGTFNSGDFPIAVAGKVTVVVDGDTTDLAPLPLLLLPRKKAVTPARVRSYSSRVVRRPMACARANRSSFSLVLIVVAEVVGWNATVGTVVAAAIDADELEAEEEGMTGVRPGGFLLGFPAQPVPLLLLLAVQPDVGSEATTAGKSDSTALLSGDMDPLFAAVDGGKGDDPEAISAAVAGDLSPPDPDRVEVKGGDCETELDADARSARIEAVARVDRMFKV